MSRKILQKVLDALAQEQPDISYIRGILETLIENLPEETHQPAFKNAPPVMTIESVPPVKANIAMDSIEIEN